MKSRLLITVLIALAGGGVLRAQATFPPEADNAALGYWFALAEVQEPPDKATLDLFDAAVAGQTPWDETKLGPVLDSNLDAIQVMQRATKLPVCNWGFDYRHGSWTPIWFLMQARRLSKLNQLQGKRQMVQGDSRAAMNTWLAGVHFSQDVARSGPVIVALFAHAMILDDLQALRDSARQGKLSEEEKKDLSQVVKAMPGDGFDWGAAWGVEFAIGSEFLQELRTSKNPRARWEERGLAVPKRGLPPTNQEIQAYREYMLAVQALLRQPAIETKSQVDDLENNIRQLGDVEQVMIPSVRKTIEMRLQVATMHEELAQALSPK